ncbi:DUF6959 family protein [Dactylosporangium matsuzakiense]|uniref:Uncharacterized protein n=1 Tax=Dactylosporangium matsuzakiense TaxID=53360 RepID=A0A9W6KW93_9ACTN|nr:hypothetical protein GCM10017581_101010 [Dactylosporangium matsuzakiense]
MEESNAPILSRAGNWAAVHLPGRKIPGLHLQGDTLAVLCDVRGGSLGRTTRRSTLAVAPNPAVARPQPLVVGVDAG